MGAGKVCLILPGGPGEVVFVEGREVSSVHSPKIEEDRMSEPRGA